MIECLGTKGLNARRLLGPTRPFHARYLTIGGPSQFPCAHAHSEDTHVEECFALTREHDSALNARGTLFYFYWFVSDFFSSAVE